MLGTYLQIVFIVLYNQIYSTGLDTQIQEIKESVELPLTHPEYYEEMGIKPPKGVILYGQPGTGKTLLAKAVANQTSATFLRVVGSELIQKYLVCSKCRLWYNFNKKREVHSNICHLLLEIWISNTVFFVQYIITHIPIFFYSLIFTCFVIFFMVGFVPNNESTKTM